MCMYVYVYAAAALKRGLPSYATAPPLGASGSPELERAYIHSMYVYIYIYIYIYNMYIYIYTYYIQ